jgi:hypothetical protein
MSTHKTNKGIMYRTYRSAFGLFPESTGVPGSSGIMVQQDWGVKSFILVPYSLQISSLRPEYFMAGSLLTIRLNFTHAHSLMLKHFNDFQPVGIGEGFHDFAELIHCGLYIRFYEYRYIDILCQERL